SSGMVAAELTKVASTTRPRVYGDMWVVDQRERPGPIDAYSMNEHEPNPFEWLVFGGTEPTRNIGKTPDPWLTWEWRTHLGQDAAPPTGQPATIDEDRIAYDFAVASGDDAAALRL